MVNNAIRCIEIQVKDGYAEKYKRALNIRYHQKRKRLKKKWNTIIDRYNKKYATEKYRYIVGSAVVDIIDRTDYSMFTNCLSLIPITCNKGPED